MEFAKGNFQSSADQFSAAADEENRSDNSFCLQEALARGEKIASVTGRIQGWNGKWHEVLPKLLAAPDKDDKKPEQAPAKKPALLMVTDFQTVKK
jgi:hypothetical protein